MINWKITLISLLIVIAVGLTWYYSINDVPHVDRKKILEERLATIPFTAEMLLADDSTIAPGGSRITFRKIIRTEISDSTLTNAGQYLNALVIGLVRATYENNGKNIYVEIAQFASGSDAYGFYSQNRPGGIPLDTVGSESYYLNDTMYFNKGEFAVMVTSTADSERRALIKTTAKKIAAKIGTQTLLPLFFKLFPYQGQVVPSQKYYSLNFLGVEGLDEVYSIDYAVDEDTLTLFLTMDTAGAKFIELSDWGSDFSEVTSAPEQFEYPEQFSLSFEHPQNGQIVAGMARRKLAGLIGYKRTTSLELGSRWIQGLK